MGGADLTLATEAREMADAHRFAFGSISPRKDPSKQVGVTIFHVSPQGIRTQIGQLDHSSETTVHEKWCFDYVIYGRPQSAILVELPHQIGVFLSNTLIVVVNQQRQRALRGGPGKRKRREVLLETRNYLLKGLLSDGPLISIRIEVCLIYTLSE
jgi:hypothetical protein